MKGPYYSVGPIKNVTLAASNTTNFINQFRNALLLCNWSLVSTFIGSAGTPGYILRSYPTPINLNRIQLKVWFDGSFSTTYPLVRFDISDESGSSFVNFGAISISSDLGNKTLRCICGPHQFFVFIDTNVSPNGNYNRAQDFNNCMGGCPHVWNPVHSQVYWGVGGNAPTTFRRQLNSSTSFGGNATYLINGFSPTTSFPDAYGNTGNCFPVLLSQRSIDLHSPVQMFDLNYPVIEPLLVMGRIPNSYWAVNLWDAVVVGGRFSSTVFSTADFRTWESITLSSSVEVPGCLFLVTSVLINPNIGGFSY